jgi:hypothetical protein
MTNNVPEANRAIGTSLAGEGYDVWAVNSRGNKYSLGHAKGDDYHKKEDYWKFTW